MTLTLTLCGLSLSVIALSACQDKAQSDTEMPLMKTKIAYAPHQSASLVHLPPKLLPSPPVTQVKEDDRQAVQTQLTVSQLSVEAIVSRSTSSGRQAKSEGTSGALAAGPGGQPTSLPAGHPQPAQPKHPTSQPSAHPSSQPTSQGQPVLSGFIYGEISITEEMKAKVKAGSVLFVIVRRYAPEGQKGMMIAATKQDGVTAAQFPLRFVVKQSDAMMGAPLAGKVKVSVRIDQDGDAISKQPGDIIGQAKEAVMVGVNPVAIELNSSI